MLAYLALGILLVALLHLGARRVARQPMPAAYVKWGLITLVAALLGFGFLRFGIPPLAELTAAAYALLAVYELGKRVFGRVKTEAKPLPTIVTSALVITLNPASGVLTLKVTRGSAAGRAVETLDEAELRQLYQELRESCADSADVLAVWLDRQAHIDWRADWGITAGGAASTYSVTLSRDEARQALGIAEAQPSARAVQAAYKRLMRQFHPDKGTGIFIATVLNVARDTLVQPSK